MKKVYCNDDNKHNHCKNNNVNVQNNTIIFFCPLLGPSRRFTIISSTGAAAGAQNALLGHACVEAQRGYLGKNDSKKMHNRNRHHQVQHHHNILLDYLDNQFHIYRYLGFNNLNLINVFILVSIEILYFTWSFLSYKTNLSDWIVPIPQHRDIVPFLNMFIVYFFIIIYYIILT